MRPQAVPGRRAATAARLAPQARILTARAAMPRMPFVLLVLALLGGSLICLLVINTTLGSASFRISQLQKTSAGLTTQLQGLRQRVAAEEAPAAIAQRAYRLGMRTQTGVTILDLVTHRTYLLGGQSGVGVELGAPPVPGTATAKKSATKKPTSAGQPTPSATPAASRAPAPRASGTPAPGTSGTAPPAGSGQ